MSETGNLCVLNVGAGDIRVTFNHADTGESAKALRMLTDMMSRGYAVLVELPDGSYTRVQQVDATRGRYVITLPEDVAPPADAVPATCACGCGKSIRPGTTWHRGHATRGKTSARKGRKYSVPVQTSRAVGVARSAGG